MTVLRLLLMTTLAGMSAHEYRWGIMSTFPFPMPVMYNAQIFPRFFTTDRELGLPFLPWDSQIERVIDNRTHYLPGSLCFVLNSTTPGCLGLHVQSVSNIVNGWDNKTHWGQIFYTELTGTWPRSSYSENLKQPKLAPFCRAKKTCAISYPGRGASRAW